MPPPAISSPPAMALESHPRRLFGAEGSRLPGRQPAVVLDGALLGNKHAPPRIADNPRLKTCGFQLLDTLGLQGPRVRFDEPANSAEPVERRSALQNLRFRSVNVHFDKAWQLHRAGQGIKANLAGAIGIADHGR